MQFFFKNVIQFITSNVFLTKFHLNLTRNLTALHCKVSVKACTKIFDIELL